MARLDGWPYLARGGTILQAALESSGGTRIFSKPMGCRSVESSILASSHCCDRDHSRRRESDYRARHYGEHSILLSKWHRAGGRWPTDLVGSPALLLPASPLRAA